jgi:hypothetical protein
VENPRFIPAEPAPIRSNHFGKGKALRPCKVEHKVDRCAGSKEKQNSVYDIVELYDLQESSVGHNGEERKGGKAAEECAAPIGRPADNDGRTQDDPIKIARHQPAITFELGAREFRGGLAVNANGGKMNHAPHSCLLTCGEQSTNALGVDTPCAVPWPVLKHAGAIYNCIHPIEVREP